MDHSKIEELKDQIETLDEEIHEIHYKGYGINCECSELVQIRQNIDNQIINFADQEQIEPQLFNIIDNLQEIIDNLISILEDLQDQEEERYEKIKELKEKIKEMGSDAESSDPSSENES